MSNLESKVVIVTGASRGIGGAIARRCAGGWMAAGEEMVRIHPDPRSRMPGRTRWARSNGARTCTSSPRSTVVARRSQGPPFSIAAFGGTVYGMCKAALERFTTGLAAEVFPDGIAVNALSPSGLVPTPGVVHHHLDKLIPEDRHEPVEYMAEAAHALCTGDPATLTGRIAFSQPLIEELGLEVRALS